MLEYCLDFGSNSDDLQGIAKEITNKSNISGFRYLYKNGQIWSVIP